MHANGPKSAASLSSGLLARKGGARPAMRRPAIQPVHALSLENLDDLGWDDMGEEPIVTTAPSQPVVPLPDASPVASQVAMIQAGLSSPSTRAVAAAPRTKCAFTLRLDAERHLRLRLLSAVTNMSAQQLVTTALDALIARHPNIEDLAADPKARTSSADGASGRKGTTS